MVLSDAAKEALIAIAEKAFVTFVDPTGISLVAGKFLYRKAKDNREKKLMAELASDVISKYDFAGVSNDLDAWIRDEGHAQCIVSEIVDINGRVTPSHPSMEDYEGDDPQRFLEELNGLIDAYRNELWRNEKFRSLKSPEDSREFLFRRLEWFICRLECEPALRESSEPPSVPFVGRRKELEELKEALSEPCSAVFVTGLGGVGKTHLCARFVAENKEAMGLRVVWLRFNGSVEHTVAKGLDLGTRDVGSDGVLFRERVRFLSSTPDVLVVIDGYSSEDGGDRGLADLVGLRCRVLVTSRERAPAGRREVRLLGLPTDEAIGLLDSFLDPRLRGWTDCYRVPLTRMLSSVGGNP